MTFIDSLRFAARSLGAQRLRTALSAAGIAVGIAAVILLTSIGAGIQQFVIAEFTQFGTHLIGITPGKAQAHGAQVGTIGTVRPLSVDDAQALARLPQVAATNPVVTGNAQVKASGRSRRVTLYGTGPELPKVLNMRVAVGSYLPVDNPDAPRAFAVLGAKARKELFGSLNPLGERIDVGGQRYRVIGVMEAKGQVLGFDLDDTVYVPVTKALELFNRSSLMEIDVSYKPQAPVDEVVQSMKKLLVTRHGLEDFTITPQQQMLSTLSTVLEVLTFAVGALGSISLLVGGVGIVTLMHIAVTERTSEIGLLTALGATRGRVRTLFLMEAIALSTFGGLLGLMVGGGLAWLLKTFVPALPVVTPWDYVFGALGVSILIGLVAGVYPAMQAAKLDPVDALHAE
jgi:putative ABC transport system permease protein